MVPELFHHDTWIQKVSKMYPKNKPFLNGDDTTLVCYHGYFSQSWVRTPDQWQVFQRLNSLCKMVVDSYYKTLILHQQYYLCDSKQTRFSKKQQSGYRKSETEAQTIFTNSARETICWVKTHVVWGKRKAHRKKCNNSMKKVNVQIVISFSGPPFILGGI